MKIINSKKLFEIIGRKNNFSKQLLINFLSLSIIPVILTSFIAYIICYNAILENSVALSHEITNCASDEINRLQIVTNNIATSIQNNPELQIVMRYPEKDNKYNLISTFQINSSLNLIQQSSIPGIAGIYCLSNNGRLYQSTTTSIPQKDFNNEYWYKKIISSKKPIWFSPHVNSFVAPPSNREFITYGVPFIDYLTELPNGIILIDIEPSAFFEILNNTNLIESNHYYVLDHFNRLIFSSNDELDIKAYQEDVFFKNLQKSEHYYSQNLSNDWKIIGVISENKIAKISLLYLCIIIIFVLIVVIICCFIIALRRTRQISRPIDTLIKYMSEVENGNYNIQMPIPKTNNEIIALYKSFNTMILKSKNYMSQIKHEQKELQKAHFKALQAQINPHFLYNTLDTIAWNIRLDEKNKAISAIMALTKFFRSSLRKGEDIVTLEQEIEQISLYLQIQELRYCDVLTYSIEHDPQLNDYIIPKLTLQPIVENAIYHGIKNKGEKGHIKITSKSSTNYMIISITDNGIGIKAEELQVINETLKNKNILSTDSSKGYGVKNVNERIKIYFGENYGLYYYSEYNKFTRVDIRLPKINKTNKIFKN